MELNEFETLPDDQLISNEDIQASDPFNTSASGDDSAGKSKHNTGNNSNSAPTMDFFNSAANTKLSDEEDNVIASEAKKTESDKPKGQVTLGKVISGKTTVKLINIFIPAFIVFALQKFGYSATKQQLKLTKEEEEIMSPVVQDCLDYITINFDNPFYALAFVASMIYGAKIMDVIPDLKKIKTDVLSDEEVNKTLSQTEPKQAVVRDLRSRVGSVLSPPDLPKNTQFGTKDDNKQRNSKLNEIAEDSPNLAQQYIEVRAKIDSTSVRRDKVRLIVEAIEQAAPSDLIEMFKIYGAIFPERNENYFRTWYERNVEQFPAHLQFVDGTI